MSKVDKLEFNIPGQVSKKGQLTQNQIDNWKKQGLSDDYIGEQIMNSNSLTTTVGNVAQWGYVDTPLNGVTQGNPYIGDLYPGAGKWSSPFDEYNKNWKNPGPFGPAAFPQKDDQRELDLLKQYLNPPIQKVTTFENIVDLLFSQDEKAEFLVSMGYTITKNPIEWTVSRTLADGTVKIITNSLNEVFLLEVTVKFKNLLLAKPSLKIKL